MKILQSMAAILAACALAGAARGATGPVPPTVATVDATQVSAPVSRYEYGMFIENLGPLVYRTLWAGMLDDRKFFYPIVPKNPHVPTPAASGPFARLFMLRKWRPIGPAADVIMDRNHPFVGRQSPRVELDASVARGIRQSGLALVEGKRYTGYIYVRGTGDARVAVTLVWGAAPRDREQVFLPPLTRAYRKYPFDFTAGAATDAGTLEITGTGAGSFHIGTVSLMPADNIDGFRPEEIAQLRELKAGFWRFPGGNFVSDFDWYDSVGPRDRRAPYFDYAWNAMQPNDVGLDEFMTLCKLLGTAPYITVNAGFGDAHSAAAEVEYMNGPVSTRLGALRARNGHPAPYGVRFWNIGNEPYGPWQLGHTELKYYVLKHNAFAVAMRSVDPSIVLLASGAMPDEMTVEGIARQMGFASDQIRLCSSADWTCGFLEHSWGNFNGITEHWYARAGMRFDLERARAGLRIDHMEPGYVPAQESVLQWVRQPSNRVRLKADEWHQYETRFPAMATDKIFMSIDEYAYTGAKPNLKLALAYAMVLDEMLRHTDFLRMSAFTMGVSTLDETPTTATLNTTGMLFKLYATHFGPGLLPVAVGGNSPQPPLRQQLVPGVKPESAGSPTYPLDLVAALSPDHKFLTLAVVNATNSARALALRLVGVRISGAGTLWKMTGRTLRAANLAGHQPEVAVSRLAPIRASQALRVAPISIDIYRFPVSQGSR